VLEQFASHVRGGKLMVLDGGRLEPSAPSTVVDCTGPHPRIIRPGALAADALRAVVPDLVGDQ
jgi:L-threonylcarbamoyladenylate synthase